MTAKERITEHNSLIDQAQAKADAIPTVDTVDQATPSITVNTSTGQITASATQKEGYVKAGTKYGYRYLTTKGATTITPSTTEQVAVNAGTFCTGAIKVAAVSGGGGGATVYSGTVTGKGFSSSAFDIDIGVTLSEQDIFIMFCSKAYSDYAVSHFVTSFYKNGNTKFMTYVTYSYEDYDDDGLDDYYPFIVKSTASSNTVTYSGTKVKIPGGTYFASEYTWYLIKQ